MSLIIIFFNWVFNSVINGWIIVIFLICVDLFGRGKSVFLNRISTHYAVWLGNNMSLRLIYPMSFIALITIIGFITAEREEFLNVI